MRQPLQTARIAGRFPLGRGSSRKKNLYSLTLLGVLTGRKRSSISHRRLLFGRLPRQTLKRKGDCRSCLFCPDQNNRIRCAKPFHKITRAVFQCVLVVSIHKLPVLQVIYKTSRDEISMRICSRWLLDLWAKCRFHDVGCRRPAINFAICFDSSFGRCIFANCIASANALSALRS
jgi:hypothetical protein